MVSTIWFSVWFGVTRKNKDSKPMEQIIGPTFRLQFIFHSSISFQEEWFLVSRFSVHSEQIMFQGSIIFRMKAWVYRFSAPHREFLSPYGSTVSTQIFYQNFPYSWLKILFHCLSEMFLSYNQMQGDYVKSNSIHPPF